MKRPLLPALFTLLPLLLFSQNSPTLTVGIDSTFQLKIARLDIRVQVTGNLATTTMDMYFANPLDRVLEGMLDFPLGEGQTVSRFAMEVNGKLREGVVVEKHAGRKAFEQIVRQNIDPGLLEMTEGNNFRTRVYPIPAKGEKRVLLAYEQELSQRNSNLVYSLPLRFTEKSGRFSMEAEVFGQVLQPVFTETGSLVIGFEQRAGNWFAHSGAENYLPNRTFAFEIPVSVNESGVFYENKNGKTYFYLSTNVPAERRTKDLPKSICLFWDVSASSAGRDTELELLLLDSYFQAIQNCRVKLFTFSYDIHAEQDFEVKNGQWQALRDFLKKQPFDGGTQLSCLNFSGFKGDEIFLFTDGMATVGGPEMWPGECPVVAINSNPVANHSQLRAIAAKTGGQYLNLTKLAPADALSAMTASPLQFIRADFPKNAFEKTTPSVPETVQGRFSFAGVLKKEKAVLKLHFGYGRKVVLIKKILLKRDSKTSYPNVSRLWANRQLAEWDMDFETNKAAITALGIEHSIVTRTTSLIVLDRVEDYARYKILPPEELREAYFQLLKQQEAVGNNTRRDESQWEDIEDKFEKLTDWWDDPIKSEPQKTGQTNPPPAQNPPVSPAQPSQGQVVGAVLPPVDSTQQQAPKVVPPVRQSPPLSDRFITGVITDGNGEPLIGVSIWARGSSIGTLTNTDGSYRLQLPEGTTQLVFSYTGFETEELTLGDNDEVNMQLEVGAAQLSEVVVTALGVSKATHSLAVSVQSVQVDHTTLGEPMAGAGFFTSYEIIENEAIGHALVVAGPDGLDTLLNPPFLIDGQAATMDDFHELGGYDISSLQILRGHKAAALTGNSSVQVVIAVETRHKDFEPSSNPAGDTIFSQTQPWLDSLRQAKPGSQFEEYLRLKKVFPNRPAFSLSAAQFFFQNNLREDGLRILSNILELDLENPELTRIAGHAFLQNGEPELAAAAFEKVLDWRPEEPQSYRDLGLALEKKGDYQLALNLFYESLLKVNTEDDWRFEGMEGVLLMEINSLINRHKKRLDISNINPELLKPMPVDIRVVLNWSSDQSDIDLWVIEPSGERCYYGNHASGLGGSLFEDLTEGYGPEQYCLKKAVPGKYKIMADFYGDDRQRLSGGVVLQVYAYKFYGTPKQQEFSASVFVSSEQDMEVDIMELVFGKK